MPHVKYEYTVDGKEYTNDQVYVIRRTGNLADALRADLRRLDPDLPMAAALVRGIRLTFAYRSVALDGVSLTVNRLEGDKLQVALIDYTLRHTALGTLEAGGRVHVETDVIGKYVQRLVAPHSND